MTRRRFHRLVLLTLGLCGVLHLGCQELFPQRSEGEKLYRRLCADCHGFDASGNTPRFMGDPRADLLDATWYEVSGGDGAIASVIRTGIPGRRHPENPDLTPEQAQAIVEHIRHLRQEAGTGN